MNISWLDLLILILASFRITRLIVFDTITEWIRRPFVEVVEETMEDGSTSSYLKVKGTGRVSRFLGELLSCYWCVGFWCALVIVIGYLLIPYYAFPIILVFAVTGAASFLEVILEKLHGS